MMGLMRGQVSHPQALIARVVEPDHGELVASVLLLVDLPYPLLGVGLKILKTPHLNPDQPVWIDLRWWA